MTPERRAEVVAVCRHVAGCVERPPWNGDHLATGLREAARELETKPSESSMVQRIEAWEKFGRRVLGAPDKTCFSRTESLSTLKTLARELLHGPPDPERERETRAEVERL